jgi:hypothetical protein
MNWKGWGRKQSWKTTNQKIKQKKKDSQYFG